MPRLNSLCRIAVALAAVGVSVRAQCPTPQPVPATVTFFILPEGGVAPPPASGYAPGAESALRAVFSPGGVAVSYVFDFAEPQRQDRNGYVVMLRPPSCFPTGSGAPFTPLDVLDFRLTGVDRATGTTLTLKPAPTGPLGAWTPSAASCQFPAGAAVSGTMACALETNDPALAAVLPATATLTVTGTPVFGNFHQIVLLNASLAGVPTTSFTLHMKQDLHEGCITWLNVAIAGQATAVVSPAATPAPLAGRFGLRRDPNTWVDYTVVDLSLTAGSTPPSIASLTDGVVTLPNAGVLHLDAGTGTVSGTLSFFIDGALVTRTLDGVGDTFLGSATMPTEVRLTESGLGPWTSFAYVGERPAIKPLVGDFEIGQTTQLLVRARPGDFYIVGLSATPVPGVNQPVGDVFLTADALFWYSVDPTNGVIFNNIAVADAAGTSTITVIVPPVPALAGFTAYFAGATIDLGAGAVVSNTNVYRATLQ
jgi:hypothetical protein